MRPRRGAVEWAHVVFCRWSDHVYKSGLVEIVVAVVVSQSMGHKSSSCLARDCSLSCEANQLLLYSLGDSRHFGGEVYSVVVSMVQAVLMEGQRKRKGGEWRAGTKGMKEGSGSARERE